MVLNKTIEGNMGVFRDMNGRENDVIHNNIPNRQILNVTYRKFIYINTICFFHFLIKFLFGIFKHVYKIF